MTDHLRDLADAVLDALPSHHMIRRVGFKVIKSPDLRKALDAGRTTPRQVLRDLNDLRMVAPHLEDAVRDALTGTAT